MRFPSPMIVAVMIGSFAPRVEATNVGVGTIEQPVNLGAFADPASIPLGPVAMESNYGYDTHSIISAPRPSLFGAMEWKEGTALDQNLAHVFGIVVDPQDSTQVPAKPVNLRVKAWPAPAYSPYTREQVMAATLQCLLRSTNATPKFPLQIEVICDNPADKSWADKFAGRYVVLADPEEPPIAPTPVPGCRVETDRSGIARVVFPGVTKTAATPARPPVLIPFRPRSEDESERPTWYLLPVWTGDTYDKPLNILGQPYTLYYDRFNPSDSANPQLNALFEGGSWLHWSIHESPTGTAAFLGFGLIDPGNLAAFLHAVVFSVQPSAAKPLTITLSSNGRTPPQYFQDCLDAGGWVSSQHGDSPALTGTFVLSPETNTLVQGSIPGVTVVRDRNKLIRLTAPTEEELKDTEELRSKREQVRDDSDVLGAALDAYRITSGAYPTEQQGFAALVERPRGAPLPRRWVKLIESVPVDPWGRPYRLVIREKAGNPQAIIASQGPDPAITSDDIEVPIKAEHE
ncbi:type II secretion system protein GspG [Luteolibacter arcticus]|uniref:Type II secretion system protein GspG n=1 Tax=Luteolibacter arcticus TaxID=1581411 RepID=A0ABT3GPZ8_9BACT|nr:type II secretion system protein GspG [Luteolibacter arcticus]MCW1925577.1 type II secretion system protein GspG [Luteolibacter arcticus]